MKKTLLPILMGLSLFLFSCSKEQNLTGESSTSNSGGGPSGGGIFDRGGGGTSGDGDLPAFGLLGLEGGTFTINSSHNLIADVGYCSGVTSTTNQKIDNFTGTAYVHSQVANFVYTAATYQPTGGIINNGTADATLDQANDDAIAASAQFAAMPVDITLGALTSNITLTHVAPNTVVQVSSVNLNGNTLTLVGTPGGDDGFIINVSGSFDFSQSIISLSNVRPERVVFNFPNASAITVNKAANIFNGTILAPIGSVIYHNPAVFNGAIIAKNIAVHSDFNLTQKSFVFQ